MASPKTAANRRRVVAAISEHAFRPLPRSPVRRVELKASLRTARPQQFFARFKFGEGHLPEIGTHLDR